MSSDLSRLGSPGHSITSTGLARQLRRQTEEVAAETEVAFVVDAAHAFLTSAAIRNVEGVLADASEAVERNPAAAELVAPLLRTYAAASADRLARFGR